jgi:uncharacterized protein YqgC (DUF456 family)
MRDFFTPCVCGVLFLFLGAALLTNAGSSSQSSATPFLLLGAVLLSCGIFALWYVGKCWWGWRKEYRRDRNE